MKGNLFVVRLLFWFFVFCLSSFKFDKQEGLCYPIAGGSLWLLLWTSQMLTEGEDDQG